MKKYFIIMLIVAFVVGSAATAFANHGRGNQHYRNNGDVNWGTVLGLVAAVIVVDAIVNNNQQQGFNPGNNNLNSVFDVNHTNSPDGGQVHSWNGTVYSFTVPDGYWVNSDRGRYNAGQTCTSGSWTIYRNL